MGRTKGSVNAKGATCSIEGCHDRVHGRGWCSFHYERWKKYGTPLAGGTRRRKVGVPAEPCVANGCPLLARNKGYCSSHYARWKRHGDANRTLPTTAERFWGRVEKTGFTCRERPDLGDCWIYTGGTKIRGYGMFAIGNKSVSAHRWAYTQLVGPIPEGLTLDHLCYTRNCVRPSHLEAVSNGENVIRSHGSIHYVVIYKTR